MKRSMKRSRNLRAVFVTTSNESNLVNLSTVSQVHRSVPPPLAAITKWTSGYVVFRLPVQRDLSGIRIHPHWRKSSIVMPPSVVYGPPRRRSLGSLDAI
jgi:hypothetical protein